MICVVCRIMEQAGVQVRANSTSDLVYKQGQAGITKASVSVTFSTDDGCTPVGYDDKKKIVVTRQVRAPLCADIP